MSIFLDLLCLAIFLLVIAGCVAPLVAIGWIAFDFNRRDDESKARAYEQNDTKTCDECGTGPWHRQWDPDSEFRASGKFYCPNCTGAD